MKFNGSIDEVRIYNRSLSAEEVWQLYQIGQTRLKAGNYYYRNSTGQYKQEINDRKYQHHRRKSIYMDDGVLGMDAVIAGL